MRCLFPFPDFAIELKKRYFSSSSEEIREAYGRVVEIADWAYNLGWGDIINARDKCIIRNLRREARDTSFGYVARRCLDRLSGRYIKS
ncbi:MAG: hypothetical protein AABW80_05485 [Nanoarchaeota archaeon]